MRTAQEAAHRHGRTWGRLSPLSLTAWPASEHRTPWIRTSRRIVRRVRRRTFRARAGARRRSVRTNVRRGRTTSRQLPTPRARANRAARARRRSCADAARRDARRRPRRRWVAALRRARARRVSAVRHPRARLRARALSKLQRRDRGGVQLQAARNLSELHGAAHGRHRRASGGSRAAWRAIPTGCLRSPNRCASCSPGIRRGRAGSVDSSFARSVRGRGASLASVESTRR